MLLQSVWWMRGRLHCHWFTIHHHKYAARDIREGCRDTAKGMMKRGAAEKKTEQWWKHWREDKVTPAVKMWREKKKNTVLPGARRDVPPTCEDCWLENKEGEKLMGAFGHPEQGRCRWWEWCSETGATAGGDNKLSFLGEIRWGQEGGQRKMVEQRGRQGVLPAQNSGNPLSHTHIPTRTHTFWIPCWPRLVDMMPLWFMIAKPASLQLMIPHTHHCP